MTDDKRRAQRERMFRVCRYNIEGREYADLSTNISAGGIFIKNFSPPPVGTRVTLTVKLPEAWGRLPLHIVGRVVHVNNDADPHKRGMGVEFVQVVANSLPLIEYFVKEVYRQDSLAGGRLNQTPSAEGAGRTTYHYQLSKPK